MGREGFGIDSKRERAFIIFYCYIPLSQPGKTLSVSWVIFKGKEGEGMGNEVEDGGGVETERKMCYFRSNFG